MLWIRKGTGGGRGKREPKVGWVFPCPIHIPICCPCLPIFHRVMGRSCTSSLFTHLSMLRMDNEHLASRERSELFLFSRVSDLSFVVFLSRCG
uniref:Uncharacterized protein n=1 Tax=Picea glauca TaxID=3330 RepID=A0A101LZZ6_PICGL|nr:hypothetical protein ABT39_MTgene4526 [Picea glauca]QHR86706.1 hypothetical protein Q903MT_gene710 [Picea sitchensis]